MLVKYPKFDSSEKPPVIKKREALIAALKKIYR